LLSRWWRFSIRRQCGGSDARVVPGRTNKAVTAKEKSGSTGSGEVQPSEVLLKMLENGYVGELVFEGEIKSVQQGLVMEGFEKIKDTPMGDKMVLLQVENVEDFEKAMKDHQQWWNGMFKEVKKWRPPMAAQKRRVWLQVHGIPLHVWDEVLFKLIGSKFEDFLDFDEETICRRRFDIARIRVSTVRRGIIDEVIKIKVVGAIFNLWVVEDGGVRRPGRVVDEEG